MEQGTPCIYSIYSPATLSSALCDTQVSLPSGLSHTEAGIHRHSWEPPPQPGTLGMGKNSSSQAVKRGKKSVLALTYSP